MELVIILVIFHILIGAVIMLGPILITDLRYIYWILAYDIIIMANWVIFGGCILKKWELDLDKNNIVRRAMNRHPWLEALSDYTPLISAIFCIYRIKIEKFT